MRTKQTFKGRICCWTFKKANFKNSYFTSSNLQIAHLIKPQFSIARKIQFYKRNNKKILLIRKQILILPVAFI